MPKKEIRPIRVQGNVALVSLTQGYTATIDAADVPLVAGRNWFAQVVRSFGQVQCVYAVTVKPGGGNLPLHRVIMDAPPRAHIDHIDSDGLNNRRENLRRATRAENAQNTRLPSHNTSGVKGVSWHSTSRKWVAQIRSNGRQHYLGRFSDIDAAAAAVDFARDFLHGDFARGARRLAAG